MRINLHYLSFLLVVLLMFTGCKNNDDASEQILSERNYFPLALNNDWTLQDLEENIEAFTLLATASFNGHTYFMTDATILSAASGTDMATAEMGFRKSGNTYFCYVSSAEIDVMGTVFTTEPFEYTYFSDTMDFGDVVDNNLSIQASGEMPFVGQTTMTVNVAIETTMQEKDISLSVHNVLYDNVVVLKTSAVASVAGQELQSVTTYTYFANEIGVVKTESPSNTYELISYQLY